MQSAYSWMGSRLHLVLEDDVADTWNQAQDAFFAAQKRHEAVHGTKWTGDEPLEIYWSNDSAEIWNKIADLINLLIEMNGGELDILEEEITSDYLIKL